jgi:hypothetical protein
MEELVGVRNPDQQFSSGDVTVRMQVTTFLYNTVSFDFDLDGFMLYLK